MPEAVQPSCDLIQPRNFFELRLTSWPYEQRLTVGGTIAKTGLDLEIWVDGQHIDEPHPIDLLLLVQSLHESGWFEIFTCGCGVGGCAGIVDGIQVTHNTGLVQWSFRRPQSAANLLGPALSEWEKTAVPVVLTFEWTQMVNAIQDYLDAIRSLVRAEPSRFEWPVHGLSVSDVVKIDPNKPFNDIEG